MPTYIRSPVQLHQAFERRGLDFLLGQHAPQESAGNRIRRLREALPGTVSQAQLGKRLGNIHRNTVQAWEANTSVPSGENLVKLAAALSVTPDFILHGEEGVYREAFGQIAAIVGRVRLGEDAK